MASIDPKILEIVQRRLAAEPNSRASKALRAMLDKGYVTTADLNALGYNHPPRAIGDVRDAGIPIVTETVRTASGKRMARYRFGDAEGIREDRHGGRSVLPKAFKNALLARYGSADCITGAKLDSRILTVDHRIPTPRRRGRRVGRSRRFGLHAAGRQFTTGQVLVVRAVHQLPGTA